MPNKDEQDACQLKAGHPPAVRVGGARQTQRTHSTSSTHSDKGDDKELAQADSSVPNACSFAPKTVMKNPSGGVPEDAVQSVPEAVKQFHEKPQPTHDYRGHSNKPNHIQQPSKK